MTQTTDELRPTFRTPEGVEGVNAAIALAQAVLRRAKVSTWDELMASTEGSEAFTKLGQMTFSYDQVTALEDHWEIVRLIDRAAGISPTPCSVCGVPMLVGSGTVPKSCTLTAGCTGAPTRSSAATLTPKGSD